MRFAVPEAVVTWIRPGACSTSPFQSSSVEKASQIDALALWAVPERNGAQQASEHELYSHMQGVLALSLCVVAYVYVCVCARMFAPTHM